MIPRFPALPLPLPWHPPLDRAQLRLGMHFEIPFPRHSSQTARFRISGFSVAKNAKAHHSRYAHPLEANFVSGRGLCGCFVPIDDFCQLATITDYSPHCWDNRVEQYQIHAQYEEDHGLLPIAKQLLEAIAWEGHYSLAELRQNEPPQASISFNELVERLKKIKAQVHGRTGLQPVEFWKPAGQSADLFNYEISQSHLIEHLNPNSSLSDCGVLPGAWQWTIEPKQQLERQPTAERLAIHRKPDDWGYERATFLLDTVEIGEWRCHKYLQERLDGRWQGNELCQKLGIQTHGGGYQFECQSIPLKQIAPVLISLKY